MALHPIIDSWLDDREASEWSFRGRVLYHGRHEAAVRFESGEQTIIFANRSILREYGSLFGQYRVVGVTPEEVRKLTNCLVAVDQLSFTDVDILSNVGSINQHVEGTIKIFKDNLCPLPQNLSLIEQMSEDGGRTIFSALVMGGSRVGYMGFDYAAILAENVGEFEPKGPIICLGKCYISAGGNRKMTQCFLLSDEKDAVAWKLKDALVLKFR